MRRLLTIAVVWLVASPIGTVRAQGPGEGRGPLSLGELARQFRAERAKNPVKPVKLITNDNLPRGLPGGGLSVAGSISETGAQKPGGPAPGATEVHDEKYYREAMADLQDRLEMHRRQLSVLQQKLAQNQMQFYPDPNKTLQQEYSRGDINKLTQDIEKKKQEITEDEAAIEALRGQLRREGGPPGWLR